MSKLTSLVIMAVIFYTLVGCAQESLPVKTPPNPVITTDDEIRESINLLGNDNYETRENATKKLLRINEPALAMLKKTENETTDIEIKTRCQYLIYKIELDVMVRRYKVIYVSKDDDRQIWSMDILGGDKKLITKNGMWLSVSPDAKNIAFVTPEGLLSSSNLCVMRLDGSGARALDKIAANHRPQWSADSGKIAYCMEKGDSFYLSYTTIPEDKITKITLPPDKWHLSPFRPIFNSDGTALIYIRGRNINICNLAGGDERVLIEDGHYPIISPDGKWLAFVLFPQENNGYGQLWISEPDGKNPKMLIKRFNQMLGGNSEKAFAWSPDSTMIASWKDGKLFTVNINGEVINYKQTLDIRGNCLQPIRWSPDGKFIIFTCSTQPTTKNGATWLYNDLYVISLDGTFFRNITESDNRDCLDGCIVVNE